MAKDLRDASSDATTPITKANFVALKKEYEALLTETMQEYAALMLASEEPPEGLKAFLDTLHAAEPQPHTDPAIDIT